MIFTVQTKFKSIENNSKDMIKEIKNIESVFFNLENNKDWHTYIFNSARISEKRVEVDNVPTFASKRITLNLKHDKKSNTHKVFNYEKGNMVIVTRNKVYHIYDFELFYESKSTIVFDIEDIREKDRDFTIYPKREISNLNVELSFDNHPVNLDKIEAMKQLKELDIKVPSMEELKEICDMGYDMHDINRFISKTYKDWDMKPCCTLEYLKDSL